MRRRVSIIGLAAATLAAAVVVAGCGNSHSISNPRAILYAGVTGDVSSGPAQVVADARAGRAGRTVLASWLSDLASGKLGPTSRLSPYEFRSRLERAATRYGFTVKRVRFVKTRGQIAPFVVVVTDHYLAFARVTPAIVRSLDPLTDKRNYATGEVFKSFPGLFLEAQDERGVPFLMTKSAPSGWGQWARSWQLFPYSHG
jgi:hypothetical protein